MFDDTFNTNRLYRAISAQEINPVEYLLWTDGRTRIWTWFVRCPTKYCNHLAAEADFIIDVCLCVCVDRNFARKATKFVWSRRWRGLSLAATVGRFYHRHRELHILCVAVSSLADFCRALSGRSVAASDAIFSHSLSSALWYCRHVTSADWVMSLVVFVCCLCERGDWESNFGQILTKSSAEKLNKFWTDFDEKFRDWLTRKN